MYTYEYLEIFKNLLDNVDKLQIENIINLIFQTKTDNGRMFFIGDRYAKPIIQNFIGKFSVPCYTNFVGDFEMNPVDFLSKANINERDILFAFCTDTLYLNSVSDGIKFSKNNNVKVITIFNQSIENNDIIKFSDWNLKIPITHHLKNQMTEVFYLLFLNLLSGHPLLKGKQYEK